MSLYSQLFVSTSIGGDDPQVVFVMSARTWTAPHDCTVRIHAFGGSGSGAVARNSAGNMTGGGAGARCTKTVNLKAGDTLTLTPGAGGITTPVSNARVAGSDGGDTTVTGPNGLFMTAGGGKGGKAGAGDVAVLGGAGGVATGGDENVAGGRGGNASAGLTASHYRATGGGALPILDVGYRGGDIVATDNNIATGGGGIGGRGGDVTGTAPGVLTGGGGAFGNGVDSTGTATSGGPGKAIGDVGVPIAEWFPYSGGGSAGATNSSVPGHGGGSGGGATTSGNVASFGGSGGVSSSTATTSGGAVNLPFGGSGGVSTGNNAAAAGAGGDGFIILEIF